MHKPSCRVNLPPPDITKEWYYFTSYNPGERPIVPSIYAHVNRQAKGYMQAFKELFSEEELLDMKANRTWIYVAGCVVTPMKITSLKPSHVLCCFPTPMRPDVELKRIGWSMGVGPFENYRIPPKSVGEQILRELRARANQL